MATSDRPSGKFFQCALIELTRLINFLIKKKVHLVGEQEETITCQACMWWVKTETWGQESSALKHKIPAWKDHTNKKGKYPELSDQASGHDLVLPLHCII